MSKYTSPQLNGSAEESNLTESLCICDRSSLSYATGLWVTRCVCLVSTLILMHCSFCSRDLLGCAVNELCQYFVCVLYSMFEFNFHVFDVLQHCCQLIFDICSNIHSLLIKQWTFANRKLCLQNNSELNLSLELYIF